MLSQFQTIGFSDYQGEWSQLDTYVHREIQLRAGFNNTVGRVLGVTNKGALRLLVDGQEKHFYGGEISMRLRDGENQS